MELCGIPDLEVIEKSRKKDHYFDTDGSPYLIEDPSLGILRIPESKSIYEAVPCPDRQFLDFLVRCLEFDPEKRMSATEASQHPWILEGSSSDSQSMMVSQFGGLTRQRDADGARENVFEESPERPQSYTDGQKMMSLQMAPQFNS